MNKLHQAPLLDRAVFFRVAEMSRTRYPGVAVTLIFLQTEEFQLAASLTADGASGHIDGVPHLDESFAALVIGAQEVWEASLLAAADPTDLQSVQDAARQRDELRAFAVRLRTLYF